MAKRRLNTSAITVTLVVLDIEMPVMDGISAAHEIRALGGDVARTPILAFSAFLADTLGSSRSIDPFDATLAKPAGGGELQLAIQRVLQAHPSRAA
jgi:CheY-like chemotaxis protein